MNGFKCKSVKISGSRFSGSLTLTFSASFGPLQVQAILLFTLSNIFLHFPPKIASRLFNSYFLFLFFNNYSTPVAVFN